MGKWTDAALKVKPYLQKGAQALGGNDALAVKGIYPTWEELVELGKVETDEPGYKFTYGDDLYSCVNANSTFQADWIPGVDTAALYTRIDETHAGTLADPIPYEGNMELTEGLYYSQDGVVYLCTRSTEQAVHHALSELVGLYVEEVNDS